MKLSESEKRVAAVFLRDKVAKEVGEELGISVHTANAHIRNMKNKFGCTTLHGLAAKIITMHLLSLLIALLLTLIITSKEPIEIVKIVPTYQIK